MKKLIFTMLLLPLLSIGQESTEYGVFENAVLTPNPGQITQFEKGITAHNKKYHGDGPYGGRVYWISNGPKTEAMYGLWDPFLGARWTTDLPKKKAMMLIGTTM
ncbi:MAG: hypothetical protein R2775_04710 [Flavobacteriaceae bacterium]